jgi:hypothetical protein
MNLPSDLQRLLPYVIVAVLAVVGLVLVVRGVGGGSDSATDAGRLIQEGIEKEPTQGVVYADGIFVTQLATGQRTRDPDRTAFHIEGAFVEPKSKNPFAIGENDFTYRQDENGKKVVVNGVSASERGYLRAGGRWYELTTGQARRVFNDKETGRRSSTIEDEFDILKWTTAPKVEGTARVDGVESRRIVGQLNTDALLEDLEITSDASPQVAQMFANAQKKGEIELLVGKEDGMLRKVSTRGEVLAQGRGGAFGMTIRLDLGFREVNKPQQIKAPSGALPPGSIDRVPRRLLGTYASAVHPKAGARSKGGNGGTQSKRSSQAYVGCVTAASDTAALERCQAFLPRR